MTGNTLLTIEVSENGQISSVQADVVLETSQDLLNRSLNPSGMSISEFKTIILMKLIRPKDNYFTWLVKYPPESIACRPCTRCRCISAHNLNEESLWINPKESPASNSPPYLSIQINQDGDIESAKARNLALEKFESLIEKPLNLGDISIGEFQTITLIKVTRPDGSYAWIVKHPVELGGVNQELVLNQYTGVSI